MLPNKPSASPLIPAVKNRVFGSKVELGLLRNWRAQRPLFTIGLPFRSERTPRKAPVVGSKALILPSPKLPTSRSLLNCPKPAGARVTPQGAFRCESVMFCKKFPLVSNTPTNPPVELGPLYSTYNLPPTFWISYGVKPAGTLGSIKVPETVVFPNVLLNTSILLFLLSAAYSKLPACASPV